MNNIRVLLLCLTIASFSSANAANVADMSLEKFIDVATPFWQVEVSCTNSKLKPIMTRPIESDVWCSLDVADLCDKNKYSLSRKLCDDSFTQQVGSNGASSAKALESTTISESPESSNITSSKPKSNQAKTIASNKKSTTAAKATREDLLFEQVQIEEQRILVDEKKLELRLKALDLQKNQLETTNTK